jgi:hypothetical protein
MSDEKAMGYNQRNDEIHDNIEGMQRDSEAHADALAVVQQFNARLVSGKVVLFWPTIAAALTSKCVWLVVACDSCGTIIDLDLTMKRRKSEASISVALEDVRCPRCNGHGRIRIAGLSRYPSI